jgi:hypothetical protein
VRGFRRLPAGSAEAWSALLRGASREVLEALALRLLEHADARARREETHLALRAVGRFFRREARPLARVRAATGYEPYPVPQRERDLLFARYRVLALTDVACQGAERVS